LEVLVQRGFMGHVPVSLQEEVRAGGCRPRIPHDGELPPRRVGYARSLLHTFPQVHLRRTCQTQLVTKI